jgi:hypothetical protein
MELVRFTFGTRVFFVVPGQVAFLTDAGSATEVHMASGETLKVDGNADAVALRLQGRTK